jgi:hypothetical protein
VVILIIISCWHFVDDPGGVMSETNLLCRDICCILNRSKTASDIAQKMINEERHEQELVEEVLSEI